MSEVETLEAGRELDALVAEKVMGWNPCANQDNPGWIYFDSGQGGGKIAPDYSTNIAAAWEVWEKVNAVFPKAWAVYSEDDGNVSVEYYDAGYCGSREEGCGAYGYARGYGDAAPAPFPLALCRAALKAVERVGSPGPGGTDR